VYTEFWSVDNLKGREHSEDRGVDLKIILKWILGMYRFDCSVIDPLAT